MSTPKKAASRGQRGTVSPEVDRASCVVCEHAKRGEIDVALLDGESLRAVSAKVGVSKSALDRHRRACLPPVASEAVKVARAKGELQYQGAVAETGKLVARHAEEGAARLRELEAIAGDLARLLRGSLDDDGREDAPKPGSPAWNSSARTLLLALEQAIAANSAGQGWARLSGQATGELQTGTKVTFQTIIGTPDWQELMGAVKEALRPFPDAARAVRLALLDLDARKQTRALPGGGG